MKSSIPSSTQAFLSERESIDCELLFLLDQHPELSQRELSRRLGVSLGRINYCLQALAAKGWLKLGNFRQSSSKRRYVYALTPSGLAMRGAMAARFLKRKLAQYEDLKAQIAMLEGELSEQGVLRDEGASR